MMQDKEFILFAPSYDESSGGSIVMHKLCSILNELGYTSYLYPYFESSEVHELDLSQTFLHCGRMLGRYFRSRLRAGTHCYKTNPSFISPIYKGILSDDSIVIYPEIAFGNPLGAKHVVRWLLHQPGFHNGKIYYGSNELYYKFNSAIADFSFPGSKISAKYLKVIHYPHEHYNCEGTVSQRSGTAYCLRKGKNKPIEHDLSDSTLIDGKSHGEIAEIFKRVKRFISYDTLTAYSYFAVLCGCESVVIPDEGVSKEEWYPNPQDRYGVAYGFDDMDAAEKTKSKLPEYIKKEEEKIREGVDDVAREILQYFMMPEQS